MRYFFDKLVAISPAQRRKVVLAFVYAFSTAGAYVVARSAADALFLARAGLAWLPWMYLLSACSVGLLAAVSLRVAAGRSLKQVIVLTLLLLSSSSIALCQVVQVSDASVVQLVGIYLLAEIRGCLNTIQYGILVNELFAGSGDHEQAAGLLGAAATLAGIVFGSIVAFEVHQLGTVQLLYVVAGLELFAMIPIALLPRMKTASASGSEPDADDRRAMLFLDSDASVPFTGGVTTAARSPYVRGIAVLTAVAVTVGTLIEFQWKSSAAVSFAAQEDQMARFFGIFHAATNLVTGLIQVLLTGTILHRFGTRTALLALPTALLAGTLGVLLASFERVVLSAITLAKGCDVVKRSINEPAILMLYAPLSDGPRRQAITFVRGIVKPSAEAGTALLIISFAGTINTRAISFVALGLLGVWYLAALRQPTNGTLVIPSAGSAETERLHEPES